MEGTAAEREVFTEKDVEVEHRKTDEVLTTNWTEISVMIGEAGEATMAIMKRTVTNVHTTGRVVKVTQHSICAMTAGRAEVIPEADITVIMTKIRNERGVEDHGRKSITDPSQEPGNQVLTRINNKSVHFRNIKMKFREISLINYLKT